MLVTLLCNVYKCTVRIACVAYVDGDVSRFWAR